MKGIVLIVSGSRDFTDIKSMAKAIEKIEQSEGDKIVRVICGGARGADTLAIMWAKSRNIPVDIYIPEWNIYGKSAGMMRNGIMIDAAMSLKSEHKIMSLVCFSGKPTPGTSDMLLRLIKSGINGRCIGLSKDEFEAIKARIRA